MLPRVNVTVTEEQHRLLLDLAEHAEMSASGFLRLLLDAATPLLRVAVPEMRDIAEEDHPYFAEAFRERFYDLLDELRSEGFLAQFDFLEDEDVHERTPSLAPASRPAQPAARERRQGRQRLRSNA